jgi:serine/threonine protein kinase
VRSQERLWSDTRRFDDVKPLDEDDIKKMIDM